MAVLARRNWSQMLTELQLRVGNIQTTGFDVRLQHALAASYHSICTTYHHPELDTFTASPLTVTALVTWVALPSDLFILVSASTSAGTTEPLPIVDFRSVHDDLYTIDTGVPEKCARYGNRLYFDRPPSATMTGVTLFYYRYGTAPDFSGSPTSPELGADVDEHIIEGALRYIWPALARPDLGAVNRELLTDWLGSQVRATTMFPLTNLPERERSATTFQGAQG